MRFSRSFSRIITTALSITFVLALFGQATFSAGAVKDIEVGDVFDSPPQKYWIVFREGFRDSQLEVSSFDSDSNEKDLSIIWDTNLVAKGKKDEEPIYQYYYNDAQKWEFARTYPVLSDWATSVVASNLNVYDQHGILIVKKTEWDPELIAREEGCLHLDGHTYYLYDRKEITTWEGARSFCEQLGGHLATISSQKENNALHQYIQSRGRNSAYFGYSEKEEGVWEWVTDEDITYVNWAEGEPNNTSGGESYAHFYYRYPDGTWNDSNFSDSSIGDGRAFLCEWEYIIGIDPETGLPADNTHTYSFNYFNQYLEGIAQYSFFFNPDWFVDNKSSYNYNHDIAKASIAMAMAGANTQANEITEFYDTLGFSNQDTHYVTPTTDSIGYAIASRELRDGSTLIAVTVRGGQYHSEWASNFTVGNGGEHRGFSEASDQVVKGITDYISSKKIKGPKKIWITGYSRAAATANITAKRLDVMADQTHQIDNLEAKNIYTYCFECPRTVANPSQSSLTNNIFSIVNYLDLVPEVAPSIWGYGRYGITLALPGKEITTHKSYSHKFNKMKDEYDNILKYAGIKERSKTFSSPMQGRIVRELVDGLALTLGAFERGEKGATYYSISYQTDFRKLGKGMRGEKNALKEVLSYAMSTIPAVAISKTALTETIAAAHYPELCLAWMNSMTGEDFESLPSRVARINCPVNVEVHDDEGKLVAQIVNDEVQEISGNSIPAYIDEDEQKVISLPASEEYQIDIKAREDCDVSYQIEEKDLADGTTLRTVNYYDVAMTKNQELEASVPEVTPDLSEKYSLSGEDGKDINPTNDISGDTSKCVLQVEPTENGTAQGGGVYTKGEFALLKAEPNSGYRFTGWYEGDKLLSSKTEYRFRMEASHKIKALFQKDGQQDVFSDVPEGKWFTDAVYYCRDRGYMAGTGNNKFSPDATVTRGTIAQILYAAENKPTVTGKSKFSDVASGKWYANAVNWAAEKGLVTGYGNGKFGPEDHITREQMVAIMMQYSKMKGYDMSTNADLSKYPDQSKISKWAVNAVKWGVAHKIVSGTEKGIEPKGNATRAQIAVILQAYDNNVRK